MHTRDLFLASSGRPSNSVAPAASRGETRCSTRELDGNTAPSHAQKEEGEEEGEQEEGRGEQCGGIYIVNSVTSLEIGWRTFAISVCEGPRAPKIYRISLMEAGDKAVGKQIREFVRPDLGARRRGSLAET